jgi:hypothetical protein
MGAMRLKARGDIRVRLCSPIQSVTVERAGTSFRYQYREVSIPFRLKGNGYRIRSGVMSRSTFEHHFDMLTT